MSSLFISAAHKSSGKTTVTLGLCAALAQRGLKTQPFKKGPDYIDPMWLAAAAGRPCYNLDFNTMGRDELLACHVRHSQGMDIAIIEGNKGLYDGLDLEGGNSNASLAKLLQTPVILVVDARGMTRGIAPLLLGYQAFDHDIRIAGVILNQLGGSRHESKLRAVIEHYTNIPVVGAVHRDSRLEITERHLGLIPSNEAEAARQRIEAIAERIAAQVDLDALREVAASAPDVPGTVAHSPTLSPHTGSPLRIGVARDSAFAFYYPDDLEALCAEGCELVTIDTLHDRQLPALDGLFIGGGFPETQMEALERNTELRHALRGAIEAGLPVYAECGGLMYLARGIEWHGRRCAMVGAIPGDIYMHDTPQGRGYMRLKATGLSPWYAAADEEIQAHEFHYSSIQNLGPGLSFAYEVLRGAGVDGRHDGILYRNVLAGFAHLRNTQSNRWVQRFVGFVRACKTPTQHPEKCRREHA
jgi:cobyrinic acid a,c-diamide synthase